MDVGDIVQLIIFGLIFLSFFGGLFDRGRKDKEQSKAPRPQELSQSGGQDRPRRTTRPRPAPTQGQSAPDGRRHRPVVTAQPLPVGDVIRLEPLREEVVERPVREVAREEIRTGERELLEHDLTDMPAPRDREPEHHARRQLTLPARARRRHPATGGDVLRGSLKDPDTLERAFIVKEVLDRPLSMRGER